jgi:uncharacterized membrane protein
MQAREQDIVAPEPVRLNVRGATFDDVKAALRLGLRDMAQRPALSLFFGLVYALFGLALLGGLVLFDQIWVVIAAGIGFPLVAPFLAAGLYEMSRRFKRGEGFRASDIFLVIFRQQRREFGWMSFVMLFVFWIWAYQFRLILALTVQSHGYRSFDHLLTKIFTTGDGAVFLLIGTLVGGVIATVLFSITVVAMPLLLDKDVDCVTAMITSVQAVLKSPAVMLAWGALIGAATLLAVAPLFIGVIFVLPILGHATWHLYERLVSER